MKVELVTAGSSLAVPIPSSLAEQIGAAPGKIADITVRNGDLVISIEAKPSGGRRYTLDGLLKGMTPDGVPDEIDWGPPRDGEVW